MKNRLAEILTWYEAGNDIYTLHDIGVLLAEIARLREDKETVEQDLETTNANWSRTCTHLNAVHALAVNDVASLTARLKAMTEQAEQAERARDEARKDTDSCQEIMLRDARTIETLRTRLDAARAQGGGVLDERIVPPADATLHHCGSCPALVVIERISECDGGDWVRRRCTKYGVDDMATFWGSRAQRLRDCVSENEVSDG